MSRSFGQIRAGSEGEAKNVTPLSLRGFAFFAFSHFCLIYWRGDLQTSPAARLGKGPTFRVFSLHQKPGRAVRIRGAIMGA